ncbi:discoidin domain-containing protein [bacterium]|nr:discoidin domain-containing protein [bacterium]
MLPYMEEQYEGWVADQFDPDHGLFFKTGHDDGMEININSRQTTDDWVVEGYRPTLNSYLFGDLNAMSSTALLAGDPTKASLYAERAAALKQRVLEELWDPNREFFFHQFKGDHPPGIKDKSLTYETGPFAGNDNGRELIGYVPWQFNLPDAEQSVAWKFLMDEQHFAAPYGPTTVSRSDTLFQVFDACCRWSGNSWPYATTQSLVGMANLLNNYSQDVVSVADYVSLLQTYAKTQYKDGRPYIAEVADPFTGSWFGGDRPNHSDHYFHSGYTDLVLGGLLGIRPESGGKLVVNPLIPSDWDWFAAESVQIHGKDVDVIWDRDGSKYGNGAGLQIRVGGKQVAQRDDVGRLEVSLGGSGELMEFDRPHNIAVNNGRTFPEISASFENPQYPAAYANDGAVFYHKVPTTRFTTEGSPNLEDWIALDFGAEQTVGEVYLHFLDDGEGVVPPSSYRVEIKKDGAWVDANIESRVPGGPTGRVANKVRLGRVKTTGVRVHFTHADGARTGLAEIEVWTPAGAEVQPATAVPANLAVNTDGSDYPRISGSYPADFDWRVLNDGIEGLMTYQFNRWIPYNTPNAEDWVQVEFEEPTSVSQVNVFLFGRALRYLGRVDTLVVEPRTLRVEALVDSEWTPVSGLTAFPVRPEVSARNVLTFDPIETTAVRVLFEHALPSISAATEVQVY